MTAIYSQSDKIPLSNFSAYFIQIMDESLSELTDRSRLMPFSLGLTLRYLFSVLRNVTRWMLVLIQLGTLLLMGGLEPIAFLLQFDFVYLVYKLYYTYQPVLLSYYDSGLNHITQGLILENLPWFIAYSTTAVVLCVVRGITYSQQRPTETPNKYILETDIGFGTIPSHLAPAGGYPLVSQREFTARTVDADPFPVNTRRASRRDLFAYLGLIWCQHPTSSLRGTLSEMKRAVGASCSSVSINGLPMICFRSVGFSFVLLLDYFVARTFDYERREAPGLNNSFPLNTITIINRDDKAIQCQLQVPSDIERTEPDIACPPSSSSEERGVIIV